MHRVTLRLSRAMENSRSIIRCSVDFNRGIYTRILANTRVCAYLKYNNNEGANFWKLSSAFSRVELVRGCNSERPQAFSAASVRNLANNPSQIPKISLPRWRRIYIYIYIYAKRITKVNPSINIEMATMRDRRGCGGCTRTISSRIRASRHVAQPGCNNRLAISHHSMHHTRLRSKLPVMSTFKWSALLHEQEAGLNATTTTSVTSFRLYSISTYSPSAQRNPFISRFELQRWS